MLMLFVLRRPTMCTIVDSMGAAASGFWFDACVLLTSADLLVYAAVWAQLRFRSGLCNSGMRRVFKSLLVMMLLVAFGWLANALIRSVVIPFGRVPVRHWFYWASYGGLLVNLACASNVFVLYSFR